MCLIPMSLMGTDMVYLRFSTSYCMSAKAMWSISHRKRILLFTSDMWHIINCAFVHSDISCISCMEHTSSTSWSPNWNYKHFISMYKLACATPKHAMEPWKSSCKNHLIISSLQSPSSSPLSTPPQHPFSIIIPHQSTFPCWGGGGWVKYCQQLLYHTLSWK